MSDVEQWEHDEQRAMENEITTLREQVEKLTKERDKAVRTLEIDGYTDSGGELWKPPLGPSAAPLLQQLAALAEQNEKLTEAYDQCGRTVQDYGRTIDQTESRLREVATHCANVEQQLSALAAQNAKMREVLVDCEQALDECRDYPITYDSVIEALSLPDLATPVLNRKKETPHD